MKAFKKLLGIALLGTVAMASATPVYVGQWNLFSGTYWLDDVPPPILTGQQAAALLFGGAAGDYAISTAGTNAADIDYLAWYDAANFAGMQAKHAQDYVSDDGEPGVYDGWYDSSAMVKDHAYTGAGPYPYVNYAFRLDRQTGVPEPLSVGLMGIGLLGLATARRRRR